MEKFTEAVIYIVKEIPEGKVMTYGLIAKVVGNPRGARQVSRILSSSSQKYQLPWHRVVNRNGEISLEGEGLVTQKLLMEREGIQFISHNRIPLDTYLYIPEVDYESL